jgi:hypothetical protein
LPIEIFFSSAFFSSSPYFTGAVFGTILNFSTTRYKIDEEIFTYIEILAIWRFLRWLRHNIQLDGLVSDSRDKLRVSGKRRGLIISLLGLIISITAFFIVILFTCF